MMKEFRVGQATTKLSLDELADFIDHLGQGTLEDLRQESWYPSIADLVPENYNSEAVYELWIELIAIHEERFMMALKAF